MQGRLRSGAEHYPLHPVLSLRVAAIDLDQTLSEIPFEILEFKTSDQFSDMHQANLHQW